MRLFAILFCAMLIVACSKGPDIQGVWYYDYAKTQPEAFPNAQYESARLLIADIEPRYGEIKVDSDALVLGGAVCKVKKVNDAHGLVCDERGQEFSLGLYLDAGRLIVTPQGANALSAVFTRTRQDPYAIYGIDPAALEVAETPASVERVAEPKQDAALAKFVGYARTRSFNAYFDPESIKVEGRYTTVRIILNYLEPQTDAFSIRKAMSSEQWITFDCPGSNYRMDRYVMFGDPNGQGVTVSDSEAYLDFKPEMKPVPPDSINQVLYMRVCR